jgi:hypothetical protein
MTGFLYHLVPQNQWHSCKERCEAYYPPTYSQDGFIHLTQEPELLLPVANHFYKTVQGAFNSQLQPLLRFCLMLSAGDSWHSQCQLLWKVAITMAC